MQMFFAPAIHFIVHVGTPFVQWVRHDEVNEKTTIRTPVLCWRSRSRRWSHKLACLHVPFVEEAAKKKVAHLSTMTSDMAHAPSKVEKATDPTTDDVDAVEEEEVTSFRELGVIEPICEACEKMNFSKPTPIQAKSIPVALQGRDVIGLAQTGSGKTAAFSIPILQALWDDPKPYFACILAPTRYVPFALITVNCPIRSRNKLKR